MVDGGNCSLIHSYRLWYMCTIQRHFILFSSRLIVSGFQVAVNLMYGVDVTILQYETCKP